MGVQVTNGQTYEHHGGPLVVYTNLAAGATFDLELKCADGTYRALALAITTTGTTNVDLPVPAKLRVLTTGTVNYAEIMGQPRAAAMSLGYPPHLWRFDEGSGTAGADSVGSVTATIGTGLTWVNA